MNRLDRLGSTSSLPNWGVLLGLLGLLGGGFTEGVEPRRELDHVRGGVKLVIYAFMRRVLTLQAS